MAAIQRGLENDEFAIFAEQGTGKTGALINIYRAKCSARKRLFKALILAPSVTLRNWKEEFEKHSNIEKDNIEILSGPVKNRIKRLNELMGRNRIIITNYEAVINKDFLQTLLDYGIEFLVCDESHMVKTYNSQRSKAVAQIADRARFRYLLTGTPILNNVSDIFMQYRILDGGKTFGDNFFVFRSKYMMDINEGWKHKQNYYPKYVSRPDKFDELNTKIYAKGVRVLKKDCLDLPPLITQTLRVPLSAEQARIYKELKRDFVAFINTQSGKPAAVVANLAITKALRLQQLVTGFVADEDGTIHEIKDNPRLDQVQELLSSLCPSNKVIVWCAFKHNYKQIARVCEELGLNYTFLTGEQSTDEKDKAIKYFTKDPDCHVIIANRRAGGIGVNLVEAAYSIVYSRNFSLADELQSEARNYRGGSQMHEQIVKINLCAEDTIDEQVMEALAIKQDISGAIVDMIRE